MASRVKTFSLCEESYAIVMQKPNKSQHLRTLILQEDDFPRSQLQRVHRINREALKIAAHILHQINENHISVVIRYFDTHLMAEYNSTYAEWNEKGHGVDWFITQLEAMARHDLP